MKAIGAFEAKTHFGQILNEVEDGAVIMITRHGREIAVIKPVDHQKSSENSMQCTKDALKRLRSGVTLGDKLTIKDLKEKGRR